MNDFWILVKGHFSIINVSFIRVFIPILMEKFRMLSHMYILKSNLLSYDSSDPITLTKSALKSHNC